MRREEKRDDVPARSKERGPGRSPTDAGGETVESDDSLLPPGNVAPDGSRNPEKPAKTSAA